MAVFAIPNPKKTTQVDFPIEKVKLSVQNINLRNDKYKFSKANEIFNQYTYESLEFLSLGVYIDINLNKINEDKTEITVEIRRKIGTFNQSHEITKANHHIEKTFECIAFLTSKSAEEIEQYKASQTTNKVVNKTNQILKKKMSLGKKFLIGLGVLVFIGIISNAGKDKNGNSTEDSSTSTEQTAETTTKVKIGEILKTDYFEITVNKVEVKDRVRTGNEFSDLKPENGISYLIINATFKNTDSESRMLMDGSVWVNFNGKDYEFDKSEVIIAEGWGLLLDQINPLTSKTTNLVYKIPTEVKGDAYWQPGRSDDDQRILLGTL
jgi:hypothetical protein